MKNCQLGVKRGTVNVQDYSNGWNNEYLKEKEILIKVFGDNYLDIQHIGSTSIPGLCAKPLIDIAVLVKDINELDKIPEQLIENGYVERVGRLPGRQKVFAKGGDDNVTHHLHIIEQGEVDWDEKIMFRNILIAQPELMKEYAELKKNLAEKYADSRSGYTKAKAAFIRKVLN